MINDVITLLNRQLNKCINHVAEKVDRNDNGDPIAYTIRRNLTEIGEAFFSLIDSGILTQYDEVVVRRSFAECQHLLHEKLIHFGNYYSAYRTLVHGEPMEKDELLRRTNIETATMLLSVRGFVMGQVDIGDSTDDYFISRMPALLKGLGYVINNKQTDLYQPVFFNLLNLSRTIDIFIASGHTKYTADLDQLRDAVWNLVNKILAEENLQATIRQNLSLALFYDYCKMLRGEQTISAQMVTADYVQRMTPTQKSRVALNLNDIDADKNYPVIENVLQTILQQRSIVIPESALAIRLCVAYLKQHNITDKELDIQVKFEDIDGEAILTKHLNGYSLMSGTHLTDSDITKLNSFNDAELRSRFANCLQGISKNEIEMEKKKPHGVSEIADMELRVDYGGHLIYWCMPFKSAAEIKGTSVPVSVAYQIFRPFFHLNSCSVLFVTAKKCSENLMNEIKRGRDKFNFSIIVLQEQQLAKLLKLNRQL
jgi:hypothetical protein